MFKERIVGELKSGKEIAYGIQGNNPLCTMYMKGGGQLPSCLSGYWNDLDKATAAAHAYVEKDTLSKPDQKKKDFRDNVNAAKKRPSKLKHKEKKDG